MGGAALPEIENKSHGTGGSVKEITIWGKLEAVKTSWFHTVNDENNSAKEDWRVMS